jgi:predicted RNA-binding protein YlxR (DUF448 family)
MGTGTSHMPVRSCVGCRERAPQPALLRVALIGGRIVADPRRRLSGRGGYIHPITGCVRRASERGGFARAFRAQLAPPVVLENAEGLINDDRGREEQRS